MDNHLVQDINTHPLQLKCIQWMLNTTYHFSHTASGRLCYRVLARPPRSKRSFTEKVFLAKAKRSILSIDRMRIRVYHWCGKGPTILLAHGWNSQSGRWQYLGQQLHNLGYNVYALDAPAHGESQGGSFAVIYYAWAMKALANAIRPETIIGHSAGGMAAMYYMQEDERAVRPHQLGVLATPAELTHFMDSFQRILHLKAGVIHALEQEFKHRFKHPFAYFSSTRFSEKLQLPGLIIHDEQDQIAPVQGAYSLAKAWSGAELKLTQGLGHSIQGEQAREYVLDWLSRK